MADPFNDDRHVWLSIGERAALHLIAGATTIAEQDMDVHIAFRVESVDEIVSRLKQAQVGYYNAKRETGKITVRPDGVKQIYFQDPDGYWIEVNDNKQ
jgi:lactoylglutathione lyase